MTYKEKSTENYNALIVAYDTYKLARDAQDIDRSDESSKKLIWEQLKTSNKEFDLIMKENNLENSEYELS